jgi:mRNA interferase RelE/StbE
MNDRKPIDLVSQTPDTVTLRRANYDALLVELEATGDRAVAFEHDLTLEEVERLRAGERPVRIWREKRGMTQQTLAAGAAISNSFLSEIEAGTNTPSVEMLWKLAYALKVDLDTLVR